MRVSDFLPDLLGSRDTLFIQFLKKRYEVIDALKAECAWSLVEEPHFGALFAHSYITFSFAKTDSPPTAPLCVTNLFAPVRFIATFEVTMPLTNLNPDGNAKVKGFEAGINFSDALPKLVRSDVEISRDRF